MPTALDRIFHARSVALVGLSTDARKMTGAPLEILRQTGFAGRVYPVNPRYAAIAGLDCHKSLDDLPEPAEHVVLARRGERGNEADGDQRRGSDDGLHAATHASGIDKVVFLASTNPGNPVGPLIKIASGGELSRFMLALKVVLADRASAPTLVFDEIDTGVGGAVADAVGVLQLAALVAVLLVVELVVHQVVKVERDVRKILCLFLVSLVVTEVLLQVLLLLRLQVETERTL